MLNLEKQMMSDEYTKGWTDTAKELLGLPQSERESYVRTVNSSIKDAVRSGVSIHYLNGCISAIRVYIKGRASLEWID